MTDTPLTLGRLLESVDRLNQRMVILEKKLDNLTGQANSWKGGLAVLIALGGIAAWFIPPWIAQFFE